MGNVKQGKKQIVPVFNVEEAIVAASEGAKDLNKAQKKEKSK